MQLSQIDVVLACISPVPSALAARLADRPTLRAAVDSYLAVDTTGVACCSDINVDSSAAGTNASRDAGQSIFGGS